MRTFVAIAAVVAVLVALALGGLVCGSCAILRETMRASAGPGGQHFEAELLSLTNAQATPCATDTEVNAAASAPTARVASDSSRRPEDEATP